MPAKHPLDQLEDCHHLDRALRILIAGCDYELDQAERHGEPIDRDSARLVVPTSPIRAYRQTLSRLQGQYAQAAPANLPPLAAAWLHDTDKDLQDTGRAYFDADYSRLGF